MELSELRVFLKVATERSFSRAAMKLHRTQPAVSQAVRRLEESVGERLFDRATKDASLTDAGRLLRDYAERLLRLSEEAEGAVRDLRDLRRGRVLIGANEASVHAVLPIIARFRQAHPLVHVDVRRIPARQVGAEVAQGSLDFGVLTFQPAEPGLGSMVLGQDELVMLVHPSHALAHSKEVTLSECARQTVIAHNDPSHVRDRVLRLFEQHHIPANILVSLPSLEGIKRAVAMQMGVALLPRRCAEPEIARGDLVALAMPEIRLRRQVRLIFRKSRRAVARLDRVSRTARRETSRAEGNQETRSVSVGRVPVGRADSKSADVRQTLRRGVNLVVTIQQQARRIPRAGDQRIAHVGRNRHLQVKIPGIAGPLHDVDADLGLRTPLDQILQCPHILRRRRHARQADHRRVAEEDLRERLADDGVDAPALQSLRRVLPRRAAAEVRVHDQHRRAREPAVVEGMLCRLAIVLEDVLLESVEGDRPQVPRRDDSIGIDVVAAQRDPAADRFRHLPHQLTILRTSVTSPASAAAATMAGLISSVRPVGLP